MKHRALALVALALVLALVLGIGVASGDEAPATPAGEEAAPARTELPGRRTETSDTYRLPSGELQTEVFGAPVNYRAENGAWQPIEEELEPAAGGGLTNGANSFDLHLPEAMGAGAVRLSEDGSWVSYRLLGEETEAAQVDGASASYESAGGGATFDLNSIAQGLKEAIVLGDASQPNRYRFALAASAGLTPHLEADGSIALRDAGEKVFATLPAPVMWDSSGALAPADAAHYSLEEGAEGGWIVAVEADRAWLSNPERAFPVTLDPSLVTYTPEQDCTIGSNPLPAGWSTCGRFGASELQVAYSQKENQTARSFLRFNLANAGIPSDAYVNEAVLALYAPKAAENTPGLETRRVTKSWTTGLNWERYNEFDGKWSTPGGDFTTEGQAQVLTSKRGSQAGWWEFNSESLRSLVNDWVSGAKPNQGLVVKQTDETKAECEANPNNCNRRYVSFLSSADASGAFKPKLTVKYYGHAPASSEVIEPGEGTVTARRLKLKAGWAKAGVTGVAFQFREGKKGTFQPIPSELLRDANGNPVERLAVSGVFETKPLYFDAAHATSTLRKKGGPIQVRALFYGEPGAEGVSAPVEAFVNRFIGGPKDAAAEVGPGSLDLLTGNLTVERSDVSIPAFTSSLDFSRTFNSRGVNLSKTIEDGGESPYQREMRNVLGPGWQPGVPVEAAGAGEWRSLRTVEESETVEGETYTYAYALLTSIEGTEVSFEKAGESYVAPAELTGWALSKNAAGQFVLTDPEGSRTVFAATTGSNEYLPAEVVQTGGEGNKTQMVYEIVNGRRRLKMIIAPSPSSYITCTPENATTRVGCKALKFNYTSYSYGDRLTSIVFYGADAAGMKSAEVAKYAYNAEGFLTEAWDPRISPELKETYTYASGGQLATIKPPGQEPWTLDTASPTKRKQTAASSR